MFWDIITSILELFIGVGVFLLAIVMLSKIFGRPSEKLNKFFKKTGENRFTNAGLGIAAVGITQSSTPTTVIIISLISGGMLTLLQATGLIMGINIGSSLTSLLFVFSTFRIRYFIMFLVFVGAVMHLATKNEKSIKIANIFITFGLLFIGLGMMSSALGSNEIIVGYFEGVFARITFPLWLFLIGTLFAALIQSSSAAIGISVAMVASGLLPFESAIFIVIGANLGTSFTAIVASLPGNRNAKRVGLFHVLFNLLGAILFLAIVWPLQDILVPWYQGLIVDPIIQMSVFHVIFNTITMLALISFIIPLNKLVCWIIKDKQDDIPQDETIGSKIAPDQATTQLFKNITA
ncbi:MAG: Na/Pi symporter [Defluviitaleaceae bacterium]|nr:Na/Pi symporter [Defluviitaleaceae bacterium]